MSALYQIEDVSSTSSLLKIFLNLSIKMILQLFTLPVYRMNKKID